MTSTAVQLATGPVSWGVDFAEAPSNPLWYTVLDEIAATGLGALELGPVGYLPEDADTLRTELAHRKLSAVGSFVFEDLHDPAEHPRILQIAQRACRAIAAAQGRVLVIIDRVSEERGASFGRSAEARRLTEPQWRGMLDCAHRIAEIATSYGLTPAFHPHAGGFVEFEDEIDRLLADTELGLCLDTGHAALAGIDAAAALDKYRDRIVHMHLKDIDGEVLEQARAQKMSFWDALAAGVFCPIGEGVVDFAAVADRLTAAGYEGFATIEQDRVPGTGSPLDDIASSLQVLAGAGFAHAASALAAR
ncbi:MAG TPA: TIM barrel protein [Solirubrobacteraceae bacterium]|jgi:inosose dehydratase|nr:TIM barrel protein [Solirubrobacteraceae bacterium]